MAEVLVPIAISSQLDVTGEERIHAAPYKETVYPPYILQLVPIYLTFSGDIILRYSTDPDQLDWSGTVDSGGFSSSAAALQRLYFVDGRLFRTGTGASNRSRTSTDGVNFVSLTGTAFAASTSVSAVLKPAAEWLFFQNSSTTLCVSTDGVAVTSRTLPLAPTYAAQMAATVVATGANTVAHSIDSGVTWTTQAVNGSSMAVRALVSTASRFIIFGDRSSDSQNILKWSTTGLASSWTEVVLSGTSFTNPIKVACRNPLTGRLVIVLGENGTYYSDDEGDTWTAGSTLPGDSTDAIQMISANDKIYCLKGDNTGLTFTIHSTVDGESWALLYTASGWGSGEVPLCMAAVDF